MCAVCGITQIPVCAGASCGVTLHQIFSLSAILGASAIGTVRLWTNKETIDNKKSKLDK